MRNGSAIHIGGYKVHGPDALPKLEVPIKSMTISFKRPDWYARWLPYLAIAGICLLGPTLRSRRAARGRILQQLQSFARWAACFTSQPIPDDENTLLIAYWPAGEITHRLPLVDAR